MEIFIVVGTALIGFYFGWTLREQVAIAKVNQLMAELEEVEEDTDSEMILITIEKDKDILFAYHKDNSQFITQAPNRTELESKLAELFPGKKFGVTAQNLIEIGFK
jgi:hypothetical protein